MNIFKLSTRRIVVSEGGVSKVLNLPCGVSYSEESGRFQTHVINEVTHGWRSRSFSARKHGAIEAFEMAVEAREDSLTFLLTCRLLPRIRRAYEIREINGLFVVRDPLAKKYRMFSTLKSAAEFNTSITKDWIEEKRFNKLTMVERYYASGTTAQSALRTHSHQFYAGVLH